MVSYPVQQTWLIVDESKSFKSSGYSRLGGVVVVVAQPFRALPTPDELYAWEFCCTGLFAADMGRLLPFRFGLVRAV